MAYLVNISSHLNHLNKIQGTHENVLTSSDKMSYLLGTLKIWKSQIKNKKIWMFPPTFELEPHGDVTPKLILNHLWALQHNSKHYFPFLTIVKWLGAQSLCHDTSESTSDLHLEKQEQSEKLQSDKTFQLKYDELLLLKFWLLVKEEYPDIGEEKQWIPCYTF